MSPTVQTLISSDQIDVPNGLPACLGDRYLCMNNPLFSHIRATCLSFGFQYSAEPTQEWRDYEYLPLFALPNILEKGTIYYRDTAETIRHVATRAPSLAFPVSFLRSNYVLHESAHCISFRLLSLSRYLSSGEAPTQSALVLLLCEAYANAIERIAVLFAKNDIHKSFYLLNSYILPSHLDRAIMLMREALKALELSTILTAGILAYFYLNTYEGKLCESFTETVIDNALPQLKNDSVSTAVLRVLINELFTLNERFRSETNTLFFDFVGLNKAYSHLRGIPFASTLDLFNIVRVIEDLCDITVVGDAPVARGETLDVP